MINPPQLCPKSTEVIYLLLYSENGPFSKSRGSSTLRFQKERTEVFCKRQTNPIGRNDKLNPPNN